MPNLFGEWTRAREWGRMGTRGGSHLDCLNSIGSLNCDERSHGLQDPKVLYDQTRAAFFVLRTTLPDNGRTFSIGNLSMSDNDQTIELAANVVAAYVAKNPVAADQLSTLIRNVHSSLHSLTDEAAPVEAEKPEPAVSIRKSLKDDHLICLECGKKFKSIKRHINASHGLTPDEYRTRWDLKPDYPMVAPAYAATRSNLAKTLGLGRKRTK